MFAGAEMWSVVKCVLLAAICHVKLSHVASLYPDDVTQDGGQEELNEKLNALKVEYSAWVIFHSGHNGPIF